MYTNTCTICADAFSVFCVHLHSIVVEAWEAQPAGQFYTCTSDSKNFKEPTRICHRHPQTRNTKPDERHQTQNHHKSMRIETMLIHFTVYKVYDVSVQVRFRNLSMHEYTGVIPNNSHPSFRLGPGISTNFESLIKGQSVNCSESFLPQRACGTFWIYDLDDVEDTWQSDECRKTFGGSYGMFQRPQGQNVKTANTVFNTCIVLVVIGGNQRKFRRETPGYGK